MNFKEFAEFLKKNKDEIKKTNAAENTTEVYELAKTLGFTGTEQELKEGLDGIKAGEILGQELSRADLTSVSGGDGPACAPSVCHSTYHDGENCYLDDDCKHFLNGYQKDDDDDDDDDD